MSKRKRRWGAADPHPLIPQADERFEKLGFRLSRGDPDSEYRWTRGVEPACYVSLWPNRFEGQALDYSVQVGASSLLYMRAENALRTWECQANSFFSPSDFPYSQPVDVVRVSLHWLLLNAQPPIPRLTWKVSNPPRAAELDLLESDVRDFGLPFLSLVETRPKLIDFLLHLDSYPRRVPAGGPQLRDTIVSTALMMFFEGDVEGAKRELDTGWRMTVASLERTWAHDPKGRDEAISARKCVLEKYQRLFAGEVQLA